MKKKLICFIIVLSSFFVIYLMGSFIAMDFNSINWHIMARFGYIGVSSTLSIFFIGMYLEVL